jgi:16S rRNA (guanine966-N2)-methyltransferase
VRITGGSKRGQRLVPWEVTGIRPMRDFVRTALFNILADLVPGSRFLDLFCGTGSVGIEALSRGATECVSVDSSPKACALTRRNLEAFGFLKRGKVIQADYEEGIDRLERRGRRFDLIFIGPPYGKGLAVDALNRLGKSRLVHDETVVVTEVYRKETLPQIFGRLRCVDRRAYGDNMLVFYRLSSVESPLPSNPRFMNRKAHKSKE